jgi:hypothetical protein
MIGAIPPLPHTPSWRGAQLKHRDNFTFAFVLPSTDFPSSYFLLFSLSLNPHIHFHLHFLLFLIQLLFS